MTNKSEPAPLSVVSVAKESHTVNPSNQPRSMRSLPVEQCDQCGSAGTVAYTGLVDHVGNVDGQFSMRRCKNPSCQVLWLDPRPLEEDLHLAYKTYYTHVADMTAQSKSPSLQSRVGVEAIYAPLRLFFKQRQRREQIELMWLNEQAPGRLLDVGCGNGARLLRLQKLGWQVEGQDVDPVSVKDATSQGLKVFLGSLGDARFTDQSFDAVIMNHVVEHLADPLATLKEIARILVPGGVLVLATPNANSFGLHHFGVNWLGLEPPRHLRVFTTQALESLAQRAGFSQSSAFTTAARSDLIARGSYAFIDATRHQTTTLKSRSSRIQRIANYGKSVLFYSRANIRTLTRHDSGEECVLWAKK